MKTNDNQPIQEQYRELMNRLGRMLDEFCNPQAMTPSGHFNKKLRKTGFVLLMFQFGSPPGNRMNYISNSNRHEIVESLEELIDNFKSDPNWGKDE